MSELETPEEVDAMNAAAGVWHDSVNFGGYTPLAGFWAGWIAGREWAREQLSDRMKALLDHHGDAFYAYRCVRDGLTTDHNWRRCQTPLCQRTAAALSTATAGEVTLITCDACGDAITEHYLETLVDGDTGSYHVACTPPNVPRRTVLLEPEAMGDEGE